MKRIFKTILLLLVVVWCSVAGIGIWHCCLYAEELLGFAYVHFFIPCSIAVCNGDYELW